MTSTQKLASQVQDGWYDAVVRIDLFTDVYDWNKGWKMGLSANYESVLQNCKAIRVAPIGVFNVGKTWLIKKLCRGSNLLEKASGEDVHTEGLSIKVSQLPGENERLTCFLDTAGLNSPVTSVRALGHMLGVSNSDPMKAMDNMLQELKRHENFIRQVAFEFAQVYLLVVGQISHRDQLELLQLIELAQNQARATKKHVIVVHNLKKMYYAAFSEGEPAKDNQPARQSYLKSMQDVFKLVAKQEMVAPGQYIDVLNSAFGNVDSAVQIHHVFLTREAPIPNQDKQCKNEAVIQYIRMLIQAVTPSTGNILADIAKIATDCAKNMVRLPPGKNIEIRFHKARGVLLGGEVEETEAKHIMEWAKRPPQSDEVAKAAAKVEEYKRMAADRELTDEQRAAMEAADAKFSDALIQATSNQTAPVRDAETLKPLNGPKGTFEITCRPVALGATTAASGDGHVKYNVSRVRAMAMGQPHWMVLVHLSIPGLAPGELAKLRETLRWDEGLTMAAETPQAVDTLRLQFKVAIANSPAKQLDALNRAGAPVLAEDKRTLGGAIRIHANAERSIVEVGNRPFDRTDRVELEVLVHTKVENCSWEIEPIMRYSRGVLTVMVCAEPSDEERAVPENHAWINGGCTAFDFAQYVANSDGSEDDAVE